MSSDGQRNILDSVHYIASHTSADYDGDNRLGVLLIQDQQFFAAREAAKADARPGGYVATGGYGGILGQIGEQRAIVMYVPAYKHTYQSDVRITQLPGTLSGVRRGAAGLETFEVAVKSPDGRLLESAIPSVSIIKDGGYCTLDWEGDPTHEEDLKAIIDHKLL